jgi:hypothetical protein
VAVVEEATKLKSMGCHWRYGQQREGHSEAANGSRAICDKANMAKEAEERTIRANDCVEG